MAPLLALLLITGCSLSAEGWIRHFLRQTGYGRAETACAVEGVRTHLDRNQLSAVRSALIVGERPPRFANVEALLAFLEPRVEPRVHQVLVHYATHCRLGG